MGTTELIKPTERTCMETKPRQTPDRPRPGLTTTARSTDVIQGGRDKSATGYKNKNKDLNLTKREVTTGTWNVRTLYATGKVAELTNELDRYRWDIVGLCEVRWTGFGEATTSEGHKIWFSGDESKHQHGVAFIVKKENINSIIECTPISSRLIKIRVSAKPKNVTIIQVYAPTSDYEDKEIETFYESIEAAIATTPKKDILIVQGDWNAKVGQDAYQDWAGTVGRFGHGQTNERGLRLLEFARSHRLTLANTLHPHKTSRSTTWHSPDGTVHNQIDYILAPQRFKSSINKAKTRTFPGADIGSDHDLVLGSFKIKLLKKKIEQNTRLRFDLDKLKDPKSAQIFESQLGDNFAALNLIIYKNVECITRDINETLSSTAEEVLGQRKRGKRQPWMTNETLALCDKRRNLKSKKHTSNEAQEEYQKANKEVRKKLRDTKEKWIKDQCYDIERGMKRGDSKAAFNTLRLITNSVQPKANAIENKQGELLTNKDEVTKRWTEYCSNLYNLELNTNNSVLQPISPPVEVNTMPPILKEEVEAALKSLQPNKSPGIDNIPSELLKHGGEEIVNAFTILCQKIIDQKEWPQEWVQSIVIPLPKKGNLKQCKNYRTISLISHPSKVLLKILQNRIKSKTEEILAEEQAGFRPGRSTVEQIFNCRILTEKCLQHQQELYHNFIDFRKAFDRVWHAGLWNVMRRHNFDEDIVQTIEALYSSSNSTVLVNGQLGAPFNTTVGVRQGCILSPMLFNIFLETIMQDTLAGHHTSVSIGGRPLCNLRFADDIDLLAGTETELQDLTTRLAECASNYGMEISTEKSQIMVNGTTTNSTNIKVGDEKLEEVTTFKYLGVT